jgi:hypothetical protein
VSFYEFARFFRGILHELASSEQAKARGDAWDSSILIAIAD